MKKVIILIFLLCSVAFAEKPYLIFRSFGGGELWEGLSPREDLAKYHSGCSLMENMIPIPQGGAEKRPGTKYVAESKENTVIRLLPFEYSTEQSYIIELGNQYARFFTSNAAIYETYGTEDLSDFSSNIVAHWKCNDNLADVNVVDANGATHNGTAQSNTDTMTTADVTGTANTALAIDDVNYITISDHNDFTFGDGSDDSPFSIAVWINLEASTATQTIISKWTTGQYEWWVFQDSTERINFHLFDESLNKDQQIETENVLAAGWHFIVVTYDGRGGGTAYEGMKIYIDWVKVDTITITVDATYDSMENKTADVIIGADSAGATDVFNSDLDNVAIFNKALTAAEVASLIGTNSTTPHEIVTPYLTADLFELKYEQSADVLYITHPDYETRKLSRLANNIWSLSTIGIENGPFRVQNTDDVAKIAASATTGSVTLTATGHAPFISSATVGHIPSGSAATSKSQTGALFRLVHPLTTLAYQETLEDNYTDSQVEDTSWTALGTLYEGTTWTLVTTGTWTGTLEIQRNYTVGAAHNASGWEKVLQYISADDRNVSTTGTEDVAAASYRAILTASGDNAEPCQVDFGTDQTEHIGIVEITAVASTTSATATVLTTLASTDATYKWSESSWSNYRGWPGTVTFFEDRLIFGGNTSQPDTIWGSVTADYENMEAGVNDDDAIIFTLSSRQVNVIQWLVGKNKILIGTSGAEWSLSGSADEPLTPSNVKAEQQSTYGSADLQANLANESVLFFQRGAEKMRELAYNWELDSYVAPDMTILAKEVTGDGITNTAFQQIPDSILWCIKENGDIAIFSYERKENITSWSRLITDDDFESVAIIHGAAEDQVWVSVERVIGGESQRYIEYFSARDFGSDPCDAFYVDSGITYDSDATTSITGLTHLEGETVAVLGDGAVLGNEVVSGGGITIDSSCTQVRVGLPYTVQLRTMPLSWVGEGSTIQGRIKRINKVIPRWYNSGDFYIGKDSTDKELVSITGQTTSEDRITFPPGYDRPGYVYVYQLSPEPLTLLALMVEFMIF